MVSKPADRLGQSSASECVAGVDAPRSVVDVIESESLLAAKAVDGVTQVHLVGEKQDRK